MALPARKPDDSPSPSSRRRRGGVQTPLLNQVKREVIPPSSPPARKQRNEPNRRIEMGRLLKSCGVRYYWSLARDYPADLIEGKVREWRDDPDAGPGLLVKMIQEGGPVLEADVLGTVTREDAEADWLERRYHRGKGETLR